MAQGSLKEMFFRVVLHQWVIHAISPDLQGNDVLSLDAEVLSVIWNCWVMQKQHWPVRIFLWPSGTAPIGRCKSLLSTDICWLSFNEEGENVQLITKSNYSRRWTLTHDSNRIQSPRGILQWCKLKYDQIIFRFQIIKSNGGQRIDVASAW